MIGAGRSLLARVVARRRIKAPSGLLSPMRWVVYIRPQSLGDLNAGFFDFGGDYVRAAGFAHKAQGRRGTGIHLYAETRIPTVDKNGEVN